jgi:hypothetical protein
MSKEMYEAHMRINRAFGKMRFGSMCNFSGITTDDTEEEVLAKIAGNIERLSIVIAEFSDKASAKARTLDAHQHMFNALGDLLSEIDAARKAR